MRTGRPKAAVVLTTQQREELETWARRRKTAQALALRARIVLRCAEGEHDSDVAGQVGVTRQYQELDQRVSAIPFTEGLRFDLDDYVTNKSLDGLFLMLAGEEKKIRQDPAARVTPLLKEVFGGK